MPNERSRGERLSERVRWVVLGTDAAHLHLLVAGQHPNECLGNAVVFGDGVIDSLPRLDQHAVVVGVAGGWAGVTLTKLVQ